MSFVVVAGGCGGGGGGGTPNPDLTDVSLSRLVLSGFSLTPAFNSATVNYTVTVPESTTSVTVTPTAASPDAVEITINDVEVVSGQPATVDLDGTTTTVSIVVKALDDDNVRTYTIKVTKSSTPIPTDVTLSNLVLAGVSLTPAFNSATERYTATVASTVDSVTVTPTATAAGDVNITVNNNQLTGQSVNVPLIDTITTISIVVTALNDVTNTWTYTVTVTKSSTPGPDDKPDFAALVGSWNALESTSTGTATGDGGTYSDEYVGTFSFTGSYSMKKR
jgi:hypothetical protein